MPLRGAGCVPGNATVKHHEAMRAEQIYDEEAPERAKALLSQLAAAQDSDAMFYLGHLAEEESPGDKEGALGWYSQAAELGHLEAAHWRASFVYHGLGTPIDIPRALTLFLECAERGLVASQWKLGQHFLSVTGREKEAREWLGLAAAQGHTDAQRLLNGERDV